MLGELERELADRLLGKRLVVEALDEDLMHQVRAAVESLNAGVRNPAGLLANRFQAVFMAWLVIEGIESYDGGTFWPNLSLRDAERSELGPAFLRAVARHRLERFDQMTESGALRYVAPILAHGGIPKYCLNDFFSLLVPELEHGGLLTASELLAIWRSRRSAFQGIDRPVERFLLYGGSVALDLLDRCIDLVAETSRLGVAPTPTAVGLPDYVVAAFVAGDARVGSRRVGVTLPRPQLRFDPWNCLGPFIELPPLPRKIRSGVWKVETGRGIESVEASYTSTRPVGLAPAPSWHVELRDGDSILRSLAFPGVSRSGALVFEPGLGRLAKHQDQADGDCVWMLRPLGSRVLAERAGGAIGEAVVSEEFPRPAGQWAGYAAEEIALAQVVRLVCERETPLGQRETAAVRVAPAPCRPTLTAEPVSGASTSDGLAVLAQVPQVRIPSLPDVPLTAWSATVNGAEVAIERIDPPAVAGEDVVRLAPPPQAGVVRLAVRGPLGSDLRLEFALLPGLSVSRPTRVQLPGGPEPQVVVECSPNPDWQLRGASARGELVLKALRDSGSVACVASMTNGEEIELQLVLPRLLWGVAQESGVASELKSSPVPVSIDEILQGRAAAIAVSSGTPRVPVALRLESGGQVVQRGTEVRTSPEGRATLPLSVFRDSIAGSGDTSLQIIAEVDSKAVLVANLQAELVLHDLAADVSWNASTTRIALSFREDRVLRDRAIFVWSVDRPWMLPICRPIENCVTGSGAIEIPIADVPPGSYRVEIAIDDGWRVPSRPARDAPNTLEVTVGTGEDRRTYLASLNDAIPRDALELAASGQSVRTLRAVEAESICVDAVLAIRELLRDFSRLSGSVAAGQVLEAVAASPEGLCAALVESAESASLTETERLLLTLFILSHRPAPMPHHRSHTVMRGLWLAFPALAARWDFAAAAMDDEDACARTAEFAGWSPAKPLPQPGESASQAELGMPREQLVALRSALDLVPDALLSIDSYVAASLDWLLVRAAGTERVEHWRTRHAPLVEALAVLNPGQRQYMCARDQKPGTMACGTLPQVTLAAAIHILQGSSVPWNQGLPFEALREAGDFALRLVMHDLVLAALLAAPWLQEGQVAGPAPGVEAHH